MGRNRRDNRSGGLKMTTEAQKKASRKYDAENTKTIKMKLNKKTDADILKWLDLMENKQGYIKELIRRDMP